MDGRAVIIDGISRGRGVLARALEGLDDGDLAYRPSPEANPIGWMAWHIGRIEDMHVADLLGEEQLWTAAGFHERFGMPADAEIFGTGNTLEQVNEVRPPSVEALRGYYQAVTERTDAYLATLTDADLDRELDEPQWTPRPTVGVRLNSLIHHVAHHGAQVAYLRGLLEGNGQLRGCRPRGSRSGLGLCGGCCASEAAPPPQPSPARGEGPGGGRGRAGVGGTIRATFAP